MEQIVGSALDKAMDICCGSKKKIPEKCWVHVEQKLKPSLEKFMKILLEAMSSRQNNQETSSLRIGEAYRKRESRLRSLCESDPDLVFKPNLGGRATRLSMSRCLVKNPSPALQDYVRTKPTVGFQSAEDCARRQLDFEPFVRYDGARRSFGRCTEKGKGDLLANWALLRKTLNRAQIREKHEAFETKLLRRLREEGFDVQVRPSWSPFSTVQRQSTLDYWA